MLVGPKARLSQTTRGAPWKRHEYDMQRKGKDARDPSHLTARITRSPPHVPKRDSNQY